MFPSPFRSLRTTEGLPQGRSSVQHHAVRLLALITMTHVRQAVWTARMADFDVADKIEVRSLEVTVNAGVDVWGRQKEQRALITATLTLARPFDSAAEADALDKSTVHYGKLSKDIRSCVQNRSSWEDTGSLSASISTQIMETAGHTALLSTEVDIFYPKGSMLGDGAGFLSSSSSAGLVSSVLYLRNVRIPCLIGVNSNERTAKQPVVVNLWIECIRRSRTDDYVKLESVVVDVGYLFRCWRLVLQNLGYI
jgi:FolB domain-containing protein